MNTANQVNPQQQPNDTIPMKNVAKAKKEQPKIIEKVIDKVESFLTQPAHPQPQSKPQQKKAAPPMENDLSKKAISQAEANPSPDEVSLPKGTTITLPDGKAFETQADSIIKKGGE